MLIDLHVLSIGSAVYGMSKDGRVFTSFVCGFFFFEADAYILVPKRFIEHVGAALFCEPECSKACVLTGSSATERQRLIDLGFEGADFAAVPLDTEVLIDEEQDHTILLADPEIGNEVEIEGVGNEGFYVCALETRYQSAHGEMVLCPVALSQYDGHDRDIGTYLLGRRVLSERQILGVVTAINADKGLVFLSLVELAVQQAQVFCGVEDNRYPEKIGDWNLKVRGKFTKLESISVDSVLAVTKSLLGNINSSGNLTASDVAVLRTAYLKAVPAGARLTAKVVNE